MKTFTLTKSLCVYVNGSQGQDLVPPLLGDFFIGRMNGKNCVLPDLIVCTQLQGDYKVIQIYFMLHRGTCYRCFSLSHTALLLSLLSINAGYSISLQGRGHKAPYISILSPLQARTQHNHSIRTDTHYLIMLVLRDSKNIVL